MIYKCKSCNYFQSVAIKKSLSIICNTPKIIRKPCQICGVNELVLSSDSELLAHIANGITNLLRTEKEK
jgi:hypothetical protein